MAPSQTAKSAMLGRTLHIETPLFWKSLHTMQPNIADFAQSDKVMQMAYF